jgi:pimeloyl-ACP methyl ester carboxylesterase
VAEIGLEHRRAGNGEPLVLIHGIGSCWQVWAPILPALEAKHDVLALSLPGYGKSAPVDGEPTVPRLVDAVEEAMDAVGFETAHVAGNSLGGWIASELAARGRARSAVALSPAGLWTRKELDYSVRLLKASRAGAKLIAPRVDLIARSALGRRLLFSQACARPERLDQESAAYQLRVFAESPSFDATLDWIDRGHEMPRGLERIECPFRVAWGSRDLILPPRQGPRWERIVPGCELVPFPGLGHVPMVDDAELTARTVLEVTIAAKPSPERPAAARA